MKIEELVIRLKKEETKRLDLEHLKDKIEKKLIKHKKINEALKSTVISYK